MERRRSRRTSGRTTRQVRTVIKRIKPIWIIKAILYGLGIYSFFYCQRQYVVTLVSFQTTVITGIVTGLLASLFLERELKYYLFSIILLGSLSVGLLFKINSTFQHAQEITNKARILDKTTKSARMDQSRVTIEFDEFSKDIPIENLQENLIAPSQFIVLTVHKGGLGFNIITYHQLVK